jgi:hypothetical protein
MLKARETWRGSGFIAKITSETQKEKSRAALLLASGREGSGGFGIGKLSAKTVDHSDVVWVDERGREGGGG